MWKSDPDDGGSWDHIGDNLERCKMGLLNWQKAVQGSTQKTTKHLQSRLQNLQDSERVVDGAELISVQKQLQAEIDKEDVQWKQRSKIDWLRGGDRNTKYYHACATTRRRKSQISCILDAAGQQCESPEEVQAAFINYFSALFATKTAENIEQCLQPIERRVTEAMNRELVKPFTMEEINVAISHMRPLKAPGPDGFPVGFFQKNWSFIGDDIGRAILQILNLGVMPHGLNSTNIALIPKVNSPSSVTDFQPISLCNVLYKIISKVLANRLKKILPTIISPVQSAFIPKRLITDNVLAAYETLHTMHTMMKGKKGFMA